MLDQLEIARQIFGLLTVQSNLKEVYGPEYNGLHRLNSLFVMYFRARIYHEWPETTKQMLRPVFIKNVDYLLIYRPFFTLKNTLVTKSVLAYMSCDFPETAESVMYSRLMEQLDNELDALRESIPTLKTMSAVLNAMRIELASRISTSHHWWKLLDQIEKKFEIPNELVELFADASNRKTAEMLLLHTMNAEKLEQINKQHKCTENARLTHKMCAMDSLRFKEQVAETASPLTEQQTRTNERTSKSYEDTLERSRLNRANEEEKFDKMVSNIK